jgi:hypothetical protein
MKFVRAIFDDDFSEDIPVNIKDLVESYLINSPNLADLVEETELLSNQTLMILYDTEDDKLGRIKDLYDARISETAEFVANNWDNNKWAYDLYKSAME